MFWNEEGSLVVIGTADGFFVLAAEETEAGVAFELLHEVGDAVVSGCCVGACVLHPAVQGFTSHGGGEVITVQRLQSRGFLLGYLEKESVAVLVDKDVGSHREGHR